MRRAFWIVVALGLYLELFGRDLGMIAGRHVYLDAGPNWKIAILLLAGMIFYEYRKMLESRDLQRLGLVAAGLVIGFFPDLWQQVVVERRFPGLGNNTYAQSLEKSFWVLGQLPSRFRALVAGDPASVLSVASVVLGLLAVFSLIRNARNDRKFIAPVVYLTLAVGAFVHLRSTNSAEAPLRYLVPVLPALYLGYACIIENAYSGLRSARRTQLFSGAVFALFFVHLFMQFQSHRAYADQIERSGEIDQAWRIVDHFQKEGVDSVFCEDYLRCLQYTFFSGSKPVFIFAPSEAVQTNEADLQLATAKKIGVVWPSEDLRGKRLFRGVIWNVAQEIGSEGDLYLFVGSREESLMSAKASLLPPQSPSTKSAPATQSPSN